MSDIELRILCEGPTETNFATLVLKPHLRRFRVFVKPETLRRGQYGIVGWDKLRASIKEDVGRSRPHVFVTTMIDLYRIGDFPGRRANSGKSPHVRAERIEEAMGRDLPNERFIPYVQVHEFEALLFVDPSLIPTQFPGGEARDAPAKLAAVSANTEPELIDDGPQTAPSKRIIQAVPAYANLKSSAGPNIAAAIGIERLRAACPHFNEWVTKLERLSEEP